MPLICQLINLLFGLYNVKKGNVFNIQVGQENLQSDETHAWQTGQIL